MIREELFTIETVESFFNELEPTVALDTETTGLRQAELEILGISICDGKRACYIQLYNNPNTKKLCEKVGEFLVKCSMVAMHNAPFDLRVLGKYGVDIDKINVFDTLTAHHLLDEEAEHGLKKIAETMLGVDPVLFKDVSSLGPDHPEFVKYAINDAVYTFEIYLMFSAALFENGLETLFYKVEAPFQKVLTQMAMTGVCVDMNKAQESTTHLQKYIDDLLIKLCELCGKRASIQTTLDGEFNVVSPINFNSAAVIVKLLQEQGLKLTEQTNSGQYKVDKHVLNKLKGNKFVDKLLEYKAAQKLLTAFFLPLNRFVESDGRVRPSFRNTGTKTGRLACSKPNLQQLSKKDDKSNLPDLRQCFVAPPGYKLIAGDYAGQELRVLAHISKEESMVDVFNKGKDMHLSTANDFFNLDIPDECLFEDNSEYDHYKHEFKSERTKAKVINFGMAYGKGAFGFSKDFGISEDEAQAILDKYFVALPAVKAAIDDSHQQVRDQGYVTSLTGRKRRFNKNEFGEYEPKAFRMSFNFLIQGYSADMIRMAMNKIHPHTLNNPLWDLRVIMTVHDECVYQVREQYAEEAARTIKECMETAVKLVVPVVADVQIGNSYAEIK